MNDLISSGIGMEINFFSSALAILAVIGRWLIFQKCNTDGYKAIIPFYNSYVYGEISDNKKAGLAYAISEVILVFTAVIFIIVACIGAVMYSENIMDADTTLPVFLIIALISGLIFLANLIFTFVFRIKVYLSFDKKYNLNSAWILGWIFIPELTEIILGLTDNLRKED